MNLDFHELYKCEMGGTYGGLGIKVEIAASKLTKEELMANDALRNAAYDIERMLKKLLMAQSMLAIPEQRERTLIQRKDLLGCFLSDALYVEEIPNGHCSEGCCDHLPWFIVTTKVGRIKIGWRKSVINIDWSDTQGTKTSKELFESENVTKDTRGIHAWGYERAKAYVGAIITGIPTTPTQ
jgi:hypothetical protein